MSVTDRPHIGVVSRRTLIAAALTGGAAIAGVATTGSSAAAQTKLAQKAAGYQPTPKGSARCDKCSLWVAPASCKMVAGTISPSGWCNLYAGK